jgi:hypothetical protein
MTDTSSHAAIFFASLASASFLIVSPAFPQAPTDAQRAAIRSECRSDYEAHCASVSPGGLESLQCLQKNMSSLSSGCQSAVRAVEAPAETKAEPVPAAPAAEPKATAAPAAPATEPAAAAPKAASSTARQPSNAQISAIRSACRSEYPKVCAGVPTGGAPALQCLKKTSRRCRQPARGLFLPSVAAPVRQPQAAAPHLLPLPPLPKRRRPRWCCGRCCRAKNCSCCARLAGRTFARSAPESRSEAAGLYGAWSRSQGRCRRLAAVC